MAQLSGLWLLCFICSFISQKTLSCSYTSVFWGKPELLCCCSSLLRPVCHLFFSQNLAHLVPYSFPSEEWCPDPARDCYKVDVCGGLPFAGKFCQQVFIQKQTLKIMCRCMARGYANGIRIGMFFHKREQVSLFF